MSQYLILDKGNGRFDTRLMTRKPIIRTNGEDVYNLVQVHTHQIEKGDWFADDLNLGPVVRIESAKGRFVQTDTMRNAYEIVTEFGGSDLWAAQRVDVLRMVEKPVPAQSEPVVHETNATTADWSGAGVSIALRFSPEQIVALYEVFTDYLAGPALMDKMYPLGQVFRKIEAVALAGGEVPEKTMKDRNKNRAFTIDYGPDYPVLNLYRQPHAVLEVIKK